MNIIILPPIVIKVIFCHGNLLIILLPLLNLIINVFVLVFLIVTIMKPNYNIKSFSIHPEASKRFGFTRREAHDGMSSQEISDTLFISIHTIKTHIKNIYRKSGVKSRIDLIRILQG
jgi:DNA-binding CsgD family transcriptional regulator